MLGELHAGAEIIISWLSPCPSKQWRILWTTMQIMVNHGDHTENWTELLLAPAPPLVKTTTHFSPLNPHLGSLNPFICSFSQCDDINRISFLVFTIICLLIDGKDSRACACPGFPSKSSGYTVIVECHFSGPISCWVYLLSFQALLHIFLGERFVLYWWLSPHITEAKK